MAQGFNIVFLINDEHRKRTNHIETADKQYEGEYQIDGKLFRFHYLIEHLVLLILRAHYILIASRLCYQVAGFYGIGAGLEFDLNGASLCRIFKHLACKIQWHNHISRVDFLLYGKNSRRVNVRFAEGSLGVHRYAPGAFWNVDEKRICEIDVNRQIIGQTGTHNSHRTVAVVDGERTVDYRCVDARQIAVFIGHPLHNAGIHMLVVLEQHVFFKRLTSNINTVQLKNCRQLFILWLKHFPLCRHNFYVGIEIAEHRFYQVVEPVENRQHNDKRHGAHRHANQRNARNDIYNVVRFFRKQVAASYKCRQVHCRKRLFFKQFLDVFKIVERVVDEEIQLGNDAHLIVNAVAQLKADFLAVR